VRERLIARLTDELSEALSLDETIDVMLRVFIPEFADWMSVYLEKRDGTGFEVIAIRHWDEERRWITEALLGTSYATEHSTTARVLRTGEPVLVAVYPEDLRARAVHTQFSEHLKTLGLDSAIVVPFRRRDKVIGAIHVIRGDNPVSFNEEDLSLVEEMARRLTPAIYNAEAYERERLVAQQFQEAALPATFPETNGIEYDAVYEAAKTEARVGGDWYDVFHIDDERLLVSVGDVAGHGLRAATVMVMLRHSLRALSLTTASPRELMFLLRTLMAKECPDVFATAFIGVLWPATGKLEHVSAGHPAPLVRLPDGTVESLSGGRRPLLGIDYEKAPADAQSTLASNSLLVLFTDGLIEASRNILDGERRLRGIIGSSEVADSKEPAHEIYQTMLPQGSFDDTVVLSIRYCGG
jgi:Stage II sporulation protein E (SpoIIE)/GAF domain